MSGVQRVNHVVLFVRDLDGMVAFYRDVLGLRVVDTIEEDEAVFLVVPGSQNHHDLGLIETRGEIIAGGDDPKPGLYHVAWQVDAIADLREMYQLLVNRGCLVGQSEHGTSISLYAKDPEGNEFEVFWLVPRDRWSERPFGVRPLDLEAEIKYWEPTVTVGG